MDSLLRLIPAYATTGLDVHVSIDPTQIGSMVSWDLCHDHATRLANAVMSHPGPGINVLMIDMEDASVTQNTIDLYSRLQRGGFPVAITIQAYLHRSQDDIRQLIEHGAMVRLVKGAFAENSDVAVTGRIARDTAYRHCLDMLLSDTAREHGVRPVVASHDHAMIAYAHDLAVRNGWAPHEWEVEMLLGVRPQVSGASCCRGFHRAGIYAVRPKLVAIFYSSHRRNAAQSRICCKGDSIRELRWTIYVMSARSRAVRASSCRSWAVRARASSCQNCFLSGRMATLCRANDSAMAGSSPWSR